MALDVSGSSSLFWNTGINNAGLLAGSTQAKGILAGLSKSITRMDVFAGLGIAATLVFAKMSKQAYNFSKEFETAMKEVQTISKSVQNDFKGISQEVVNMSKTVPDSAKKLTKALYQIVSAGYDGAEAMDILKTSAELATASVTDTFTAADALTYVMNAYGEAAGTAAEISDKLFTIVKLGKVKMEELGPTLSMVTGLAAEAGMSFNDLGAFYAEAVKKIQPHIVSTGIRGFVTALLRASKEGAEAAKAAKEMGIEFDIATLKSKGLEYMLKQMSEATEGQKQKLMELFPNVRGLIGLLAIMTDGGEAYNKTLNEIENSLGATDKAFKIMMDDTTNQLAILHNNVMAKLKPLGDTILKQMNNVAKGINIAMSGANDEMSRLSDTYSRLVNTLQTKKNRIDDLVSTIETLRGKTKLSKEETYNLKAAEEALAVYFPILGRATEGVAGSFDILNAAKNYSLELSLKIANVELTKAELEKKKAEIEILKIKQNEAEVNKELDKIQEKVTKTGDSITGMVTRSIDEFIRGIRMYPTDDFTKDIKGLEQSYEEAGIVVENLGDKIRDIQKDLTFGLSEEAAEKQKKLIESVVDTALEGNEEWQIALRELDIATGEVSVKTGELDNRITELNISIEGYKKTIEELENPIPTPIPPKTGGGGPSKTTTTTAITDNQIKAVEDSLKNRASQYQKYLADVAQFGEEYVEEHNAQLAKDGENYGEYLDNMLEMYAENADLTKEIMEDIYEYNKEITAKKKEAEEELFNYLAELREKDLEAEKDNFEAIIKNYKEGSTEYLLAVEKHKENEKAINLKYDKEIADAALALFKENLEQQTGELDEHYKQRLKTAKAGLYKETAENKEYFEFITIELNKILKKEEETAKEKRELLDSYFESYQTTEEKIVSIHEKTAELLLLTDNKSEKERLENIEERLIAEIKYNEAVEEIGDKRGRRNKELNNEELRNRIKHLNEMKVKYSDYADIIIMLNEKIAESQKQLWDNTINEINDTVDALHTLADVVGNFDTELESMINNMANLASGVAEIVGGLAIGGIGGFAAALGGIASILPSILNLFIKVHSEVSAMLEDLYDINYALQTQQYALNAATPEGTPGAIQDRIALLKQQIAVYQELIAAEEAATSSFLWWEWSTTDQEKIDQWKLDILEAQQQINNLEEDYIAAQEALIPEVTSSIVQQVKEVMKEVAGITQETIADSIAEGFSEGLDSAVLFANTFNDMMREAIIDAFKKTIITQYLKDWMTQFELLSGGGLTVGEIASLAATYQTAILAASEQWEAMQALMEASGIKMEEIQRTGLTGAIAGITEETAGILAGQFQAIRINTVEVLSNMENIIIINSRIADNTEYNRYLEHISAKLDEMSSSQSLRAIGGS